MFPASRCVGSASFDEPLRPSERAKKGGLGFRVYGVSQTHTTLPVVFIVVPVFGEPIVYHKVLTIIKSADQAAELHWRLYLNPKLFLALIGRGFYGFGASGF